MPSPTHPIAIHKFGGAALAGASAIAHVGTLLAQPSLDRRVVVTSAYVAAGLECATRVTRVDSDGAIVHDGVSSRPGKVSSRGEQ